MMQWNSEHGSRSGNYSEGFNIVVIAGIEQEKQLLKSMMGIVWFISILDIEVLVIRESIVFLFVLLPDVRM